MSIGNPFGVSLGNGIAVRHMRGKATAVRVAIDRAHPSGQVIIRQTINRQGF